MSTSPATQRPTSSAQHPSHSGRCAANTGVCRPIIPCWVPGGRLDSSLERQLGRAHQPHSRRTSPASDVTSTRRVASDRPPAYPSSTCRAHRCAGRDEGRDAALARPVLRDGEATERYPSPPDAPSCRATATRGQHPDVYCECADNGPGQLPSCARMGTFVAAYLSRARVPRRRQSGYQRDAAQQPRPDAYLCR